MLGLPIRFPLLVSFGFLFVRFSLAQSFTPGNLAVLRVGDGTQTLVSSGNTLFLDQYSTGGSLLSTINIPDTGAGALLISGASSSEGGLTRSSDFSLLILAGYNTNRGSVSGSLSSQSAVTVPRAAASIDAFGAYHLAEASTLLYSSNNIRCAASDGSNNFWTAGSPGGAYLINPPQAPVQVQAGGGNIRQVKIVSGTLYFSTQAGSAGIYSFQGGGLPKSAVNPVLLFATGANSQPAGLALNKALNVAYVADQRATAGIQKWTNNGSGWTLAYTFSTGAGAFDLAVDFSGSVPIVYATTAEASANRLLSITDTGALSAIRVLASAGANRNFRGLDFVPDIRPVIVASPQSQTVTNGSEVVFLVTAQSHYPLSYQWQKNGTNLNTATNSSLTLQNVSSSDQGGYSVMVSNAYGSALSSTATLTVTQGLTPPDITSQPAGQNIPLGGTVTFSVTATGTQPLAFQWQFNGSVLQDQTNATLVLNNLGPANQGNYLVIVSNPVGSTNSLPAALTVSSPPASFVPYVAAGSIYSQDFNSLPDPGTTSVNANNPVQIAGVIYGLADPFDFSFPVLPNGVDPNTGIGLGGLGLSNSMPGWYALGQIAPKFGASAGDQSTGGAISFGSTNSLATSTNRALGLLATSSTGPTAFGLKLINQTAGTLNQVTVHFTGELWRQAAVPKLLSLSYLVDLSATNGFSTNSSALLTNLDVRFAPVAADTNPVPVDGTVPANQLSLGLTNAPIADWPTGAAFWLIWQMADPTGKGQGLAIDDLVFSASSSQGGSTPQLSIVQTGTNVVVSWPASFSGFVLQSNAALSQPGAWASVSQPVILTNGANSAVVPIESSAQFYRLKK